MKTLIFIIMATLITLTGQTQSGKSFYDFKVTAIDGKPFDISTLKGKKVLVVNVASKCGYTPQYEQLEALYQKYGSGNFTIIGFPANNFLGQEPGTNAEIIGFCTTKYGVTFPMMSKISVKGKDIDPLYKWLTTKSLNGVLDAPVKWNFQKFMIDENGNLVGFTPPGESPTSDRIQKWIEGKGLTNNE
ncbi:MAG: glutathione peroxidase [Bacteroidales bacterium]|nr:glutathione peroxidase [Bacteroidales bacterium]